MLFFGLILFLFLQIIRPQDFIPGLEGSRLVLYLMTFLLFVLLFSPIEKKAMMSPQDKFSGLFFVAIAASSLSTFWITNIINVSIATLKTALMYYFVVIVASEERRFKIATISLIVMMWIVALMGVLQFYGLDITGVGMKWAPNKQVWQIYGIGNFDNPNDLAYSTVLVVPFALAMLFIGKGFFARTGSIVLLTVSIYCIYLTRSRGGQLALASCIGSWLYFWLASRKWKRRLIIFGGLGILALFSTQTAGFREDRSAMGRVESWSEGWQLVKSNPILGVGKDQFEEYHSLDTHNSFVRAGSETGLFGLYAFVGLIYFSLLTVFKIDISISDKSKRQEWVLYYSGYGSFIISYAVGSIFSTRTYDLIFLICVALVGILGRLALQGSENVSSDGILSFGESRGLWSKNVFAITTGVLIVWYLFLRQVW